MLRFLLLIFILPLFVCGQQKAKILNEIIKINRLDSKEMALGFPLDTTFMSLDEKRAFAEIPSKYDNYKNFQELAKLITHSELIELTNDTNAVLRVFAIRKLIEERDYNFNFLKSFLNEFNKKDTISSQYGCIISDEPTYTILLGGWSGDWNYARSTNAKEDSKFLNYILRPIDSFILFENFDFGSAVYEDIFDRQKFGTAANDRILELINTKFNFWAFSYLRKDNPKLYRAIKTKTVANFMNNRETLLIEEPDYFTWFWRYLITSHQYENAKLLLEELKEKKYSKDTIDFMLMGIDKKLIKKVE